MNTGEFLLASRLLERASDEFSNHGCNDMDEKMFDGISDADKLAMEQAYNKYNSPDHEDYVKFDYIADWAWMSYLSKLLKNQK
jgi:hypothetical protein